MQGKAAPVILGISLGTRAMGMAVYRNHVLVDCRVRSFKSAWSEAKLNTIVTVIQKHIQQHNINTIAIKEVTETHGSIGLLQTAGEIETLARKNTIEVRTYTLKELKAHCRAGKNDNKDIFVEYMRQKYPAVVPSHLAKDTSTYNYYMRMFEAVVCVDVCHKSEA